MSRGLPAAALLLNATVWGLAWWPVRRLSDAGLHSLWATALIYSIATFGIVLLFRVRPDDLRAAGPRLLALALASGLANACFNWAVTLGGVARVALLFYLMPIWAALLARWLLREALTLAIVTRIAFAIVGASLILLDGEAVAARHQGLADALAILAGIGFAINTVMLRLVVVPGRIVRPGAVALAMFSGGAVVPGLFAALFAVAGAPLALPAQAGAWMLLALLTAVAYLIGNLTLQFGAARLPANTTALIMLFEIAVAAMSASWLAGENLSVRALLGGALIVGAAASSLLSRPARVEGRVGSAAHASLEESSDDQNQQDQRQRRAPK